MNTTSVTHPVILHKLTQLRRKETSNKHFRELLREITFFLGYEATRDVKLNDLTVETPVAEFVGKEISSKVTLVPIMRAGLGMVDAMQDILPNSEVQHLGMFRRGNNSLLPIVYFNKLPPTPNTDIAFVLEPMIATSGTITAAIDILKEWGVKDIRVVTVIASRPGLEQLAKEHPDITVTVAAIDDTLTADGYISPGLGDAGDRQFNVSDSS